jgi:thioredoxin-dependent peroxiredoxin
MNHFKSFATVAFSIATSLAAFAAAPVDFTVTSPIDGKAFRLSEAKGRYVALHFLLKTECPFCLRHTAEYSMKAPTVAGVTHVFLKPDSDDEIKSWAGKVKAPHQPKIYRDAEAKLAREFGIPDGYKFHGQTVHYPALVLLNPDGKEVFRYVGKSNTDRLPWDKFAATISALSANAAAKDYNLPPDKVALSGYDPVSYLTQGKAVKGSPEISSVYRGVSYRFVGEDNRALFAENPEKYLPTYGGWCATAMAKGKKVEIDPTNFKVTNGRLFLFFKAFYANARSDWDKDEPAQTRKADTNWKRIAGE